MSESLVPVLEESFELNGYECRVYFMPMGHRCGYVKIPEDHPWYRSSRLEQEISCHGGITYRDNYLGKNTSEDNCWIGFDCAHLGDAIDAEGLKMHYGEEGLKQYSHLLSHGTVRSLEYCKLQCWLITKQLEEVVSHDKIIGEEMYSYVADAMYFYKEEI